MEDLIRWCSLNKRKRIRFQNKDEPESFDMQGSMFGGMGAPKQNTPSVNFNGMLGISSNYSMDTMSNSNNGFTKPQQNSNQNMFPSMSSQNNMFSNSNQSNLMDNSQLQRNNIMSSQQNINFNSGGKTQNKASSGNDFDDLFS